MASELILIVDDAPESRMLVCDVLEHSGYRVIEAGSAESGVESARQNRPALILMDLRLPGMDGYGAISALRSDPATRAIPVIAITASAMNADRARIARAGFDGYQPKPIDVLELVLSVREALARAASATSK
jgi:two-component system cell cycle response regulator DivK